MPQPEIFHDARLLHSFDQPAVDKRLVVGKRFRERVVPWWFDMPQSAIMAYSVRVFSNVAIAQLSHEFADLNYVQVERRSGGGMPA